MIRPVLVALFFLLPTWLYADANLVRLYNALQLDAYVQISQSEGLADVDVLSQDMLGRPPSARLNDQMSAVYDFDRMKNAVMAGLDSLSPDQIAQSLLFFESEIGTRIVDLELSARKAISDDAIEAAARESWRATKADTTSNSLLEHIADITTSTDLVNSNVSGALNSNLRFYQGMASRDGLDLPEDQILTLVWAQEPDIRNDTTEWLGAYMLMAYAPLDLADVEIYAELWRTETGGALNAAIFAGFNKMYNEISYATGQVIALNMAGQDL